MHPNYTVVIQFDPENERFIARIPELAGCMAEGKTYEEALKQAHDAIAARLQLEDPAAIPPPNYYPESMLM
jgi:predicted RNase H-like HicB family nuclease